MHRVKCELWEPVADVIQKIDRPSLYYIGCYIVLTAATDKRVGCVFSVILPNCLTYDSLIADLL